MLRFASNTQLACCMSSEFGCSRILKRVVWTNPHCSTALMALPARHSWQCWCNSWYLGVHRRAPKRYIENGFVSSSILSLVHCADCISLELQLSWHYVLPTLYASKLCFRCVYYALPRQYNLQYTPRSRPPAHNSSWWAPLTHQPA